MGRMEFTGRPEGMGPKGEKFLRLGSRAETPIYPPPSWTRLHDAHGIVEPIGTSRVPSAVSSTTRR